MTLCTTTGCDRPTRDNAYICDDDLDQFAKVLGDVTWLDDELETTITKQRAATNGDGARSNETPLLFHAAASDSRDKLASELWTLVRFCVEEHVRASDPMTALPDRNIIAMSRWLLWRVDGLAYNDLAHELIASTSAAVRTCQRIIDRPPDRRYAGPCSECKRDLYHRPDATEVTCTGCGQRWDVTEQQAWTNGQILEFLTGRLVTASEGAKYLGRLGIEVKQETIGKWRERKRIVGAEVNQRWVYRWDDLVELAARNGRKAS